AVRSIARRFGVSHTAINNRARDEGWEKVPTGKFPLETGNQKRKPEKASKAKPSERVSTTPNDQLLPDTKPERAQRKVVTNHPPFQPGNQAALKHGGYARRMLWPDAVTEDARALTLNDELFRLRAGNLTAAENIGRWLTQMEDAESDEARDKLAALMVAADKAMMRNTVRIESLERTLATLAIDREMPMKIIADREYRAAATEKISLEADKLRRDAGIDDGNGERDLNDFYSDIQTDTESGSA
ncbi:hypothetical protein CWM85_30995, partial [Klebsiella michiganensis]